MAVTLIKEDGTQVTGANTYLTRAEADLFFESYFNSGTWTAATVGNKDIVLANAARILDDQFTWEGVRVAPNTQAMQWPRSGAAEYDRHVLTTEVPRAIREAQAILAQSILLNTSFMVRDPGAGGADQIASIGLGKGALNIQYQPQTQAGANSLRYKTVVTAEILQMLAPYGAFKHGSSMVKVRRG